MRIKKMIFEALANYHYNMFNSYINKSSYDAMKHFNKALAYETKYK